MVKDVYFTLRTGFHVRLPVEETAVVGDIKQTLHKTKLTHFKPENMKFICNVRFDTKKDQFFQNYIRNLQPPPSMTVTLMYL